MPVLDVVPLFETAADLGRAPDVLTGIAGAPEVAERLAASGRQLEVMLGYSDSAKEVGPRQRHPAALRRPGPAGRLGRGPATSG